MRFREFSNLTEFDAGSAISSAGNIISMLSNPLGALDNITGTTSTDSAGAGSSTADIATIQDPDFNRKLEKVANKLGVRANDLLAIMKQESGVDPSRVNSTSKATGLIQFMPDTARRLGTTTDALAKMSAVEQLDYVYLYYKSVKLKPGSDVGDMYVATFYPAAAGQPDNYVISSRGNKVYNQNAGLDRNKDGTITVGDVKKSVSRFV